MTNLLYHKNVKPPTKKKNWEGKLMGTCTQLQAQVKKKKRKKKKWRDTK